MESKKNVPNTYSLDFKLKVSYYRKSVHHFNLKK